MSSVFEEILTSTIGFIIAMVILSAIIGGGLYGYWLYVNHVTLENELMPIAEVVPYNGSYYLGIVNTGYEPIIIKDVYLNNSGVLSINSKPLTHNQWFFEQTSQLPTAVMVCSAIDPRVCEVVPVHGWSTVDPSSILGNNQAGTIGCPIRVVVNDPDNASWGVIWQMRYSVSEGYFSTSTSYQWCIIPPYYPIPFLFQLEVNNPSFNPNECQISSYSIPPTVPPWVFTNFDGTIPTGNASNSAYYSPTAISFYSVFNGTPITMSFTITCR
jgi:hypothetical protein